MGSIAFLAKRSDDLSLKLQSNGRQKRVPLISLDLRLKEGWLVQITRNYENILLSICVYNVHHRYIV